MGNHAVDRSAHIAIVDGVQPERKCSGGVAGIIPVASCVLFLVVLAKSCATGVKKLSLTLVSLCEKTLEV